MEISTITTQDEEPQVDEFCEALEELARLVRVASKDPGRTLRALCLILVLGATIGGAVIGILFAMQQI